LPLVLVTDLSQLIREYGRPRQLRVVGTTTFRSAFGALSRKLREQIEALLVREKPAIDALLRDCRIPRPEGSLGINPSGRYS
jgi:hypothetical protein